MSLNFLLSREVIGLQRRAEQESPYEDSLDTRLTNYVAFIGFTVLVWDHLLTLKDEVRYIWFGRKTAIVYLFFINRYFTPLSFIGNLIAYFSDWSYGGCQHFVRFEGSTVALAVMITGLMMLVRIRALYADQPKVIWAVFLLFLGEVAINAFLLTHGEAVQHSPSVHACSMIFDPSLHFLPSLSAWVPLFYDTVVILLTIYRCLGPVKQRTASHIVRTLLKDGLLYYSVIFSVNLVLAIMIASSPPGVKNICAQLEQLLTVAMISRITLNLKHEAFSDPTVDTYISAQEAHDHSRDLRVYSATRRGSGRTARNLDPLSSLYEAQPSRPQSSAFFSGNNKTGATESFVASNYPDSNPQKHMLNERDVYELRVLKASV